MQIVGCTIYPAESVGPVGEEAQYIPMGPATSLIGRNDSGKSTLLRLIRQLGETNVERSDTQSFSFGEFYVSTDPEQADRLVAVADPGGDGFIQIGFSKSVWDYQRAAESNPRSRTEFVDALLETIDEDDQDSRIVLDHLRGSTTFSINHDLVSWCIPREDFENETLKSAMKALGTRGHDNGGIMPNAPVIVSPVGRIAGTRIIDCTNAPNGIDDLVVQLNSAIASAITIRREHSTGEWVLSEEDAWATISYDGEGDDQRVSVGLHPIAAEVRNEVSRRLNAILADSILPHAAELDGPDFLRGFLSRDKVEIQLIDDARGVSFELHQLADGYSLWLELALVKLVDELEWSVSVHSIVKSLGGIPTSNELQQHTVDMLSERIFDEPFALVDASQRDHTLLDAVTEPTLQSLTTPESAPLVANMFKQSEAGLKRKFVDSVHKVLGLQAPRLILIDEPERHLHPALLRKAAISLADFARSGGAQLVITTHSAHFLRIGEGQKYIHVTRPKSEGTKVREIQAEELQRLDSGELARDLGFDRGEYLSLIRVILWVEGRDEQAVFETVFNEELFQNGILVAPMHGRSRKEGTLEAAVFAKLPGVKQVVAFDRISPEFSSHVAHSHGADYKSFEVEEERDAAELIWMAFQDGIEIECTGHPHSDIWDVLDAECVDDYARLQNPETEYSHSTFDAAWIEHQTTHGLGNGARKQFLQQKLGMREKPDITVIAEMMKARDRKPQELLDIIEMCEHVSLEVS